MRIKYSVPREGEVWQPWPDGLADHIEEWQLDAKRKAAGKGQNHIWIEGVQCHALCLSDGRVWDVVNGFREHSDWRKWDWNSNHNTDMKIDPGSGTPDWRSCLQPAPRPCTCHPADNPPRPCPRKYALDECRQAAKQEAANAVCKWPIVEIDPKRFADEYLNQPQPGDIVKVKPKGSPLRALSRPKSCPNCNSIMYIWTQDYCYHCTNCGHVE